MFWLYCMHYIYVRISLLSFPLLPSLPLSLSSSPSFFYLLLPLFLSLPSLPLPPPSSLPSLLPSPSLPSSLSPSLH